MPKREDESPEVQEPVIHAMPAKQFTEKELMDYPVEVLMEMLDAHGIEYENGTKKTNKRLRLLILDAQSEGVVFDVPSEAPTASLKAVASTVTPTVTYNASALAKTADFENVRVEIGVTLPVDHTPQMLADIETTVSIARDLVLNRLADELANVKAVV